MRMLFKFKNYVVIMNFTESFIVLVKLLNYMSILFLTLTFLVRVL